MSGIRGRLLSPHFASTVLHTLEGATPLPRDTDAELERLGCAAEEGLGPTSSARTVADALVLPLLRVLHLRVSWRRDLPEETRLMASGRGPAVVPVVVRGWSASLDSDWRELVRDGIAADAEWAIACNGREFQIVDVQRTWTRHTLSVDVPALGHDTDLRRIVWTVSNGAALTAVPSLLGIASRRSAEHGVVVCRSLGDGVVRALRSLYEGLGARSRRSEPVSAPLEQCLTVIFRLLFLLFAEARGLVPVWHPIYRDQYSINSIVSVLMSGRPVHGLWDALRAISRLAHLGCETDAFTVTAFNGRLFSPQQTDGVDHRRIPDDVLARVVLDIGATRTRAGLERTRYSELDVEQLGSVYEQVLEYQPDGRGTNLIRTRDARKATGTFYTPRELAAALVEQTLGPLVSGRSAAQILNLRILDPAMGSGAFLVAACRYLARQVEDALVAEGTWHATEVNNADRVALRRNIVQRCLYGVDVNPVAVQLARLSLWLVALVHDKPLSFLDHHLVVGNSLVGATPDHLHRETAQGRKRPRPTAGLPLFDHTQLEEAVASAGRLRDTLAREPDDSADQVRSKEARLMALRHPDSAIGAWNRALDLWCSTWFWHDDRPPGRAVVADVLAGLLGGAQSLAPVTAEALLGRAGRVAERERFLHWPVAFPEVFQDERGQASPDGGFDAVIGNPPWDMVRGDSGDSTSRGARKTDAHRLTRFVRDSGVYQFGATAHVNRYALFTERALQLTRRTGRVGLVLPAGVITDAGTAALRTRIFSSADVDSIVGLDNRAAIFPVHRSVRFVLLTATAGGPTLATRCRFGLSTLAELGDAWASRPAVTVTRSFLERASGANDLGIPDLTSELDLTLLERVTAEIPTLESSRGWHVRFGRELNATDDKDLMVPHTGRPPLRPIVEGKMITPFRVNLDRCTRRLAPTAVLPHRIPSRARLAYREVAGASNRLTLIAAIIPAQAVTTHTAFCLKTAMPLASQRVLCALLNSLIANYLVRLRVSTHVTATIMAHLRVPVVNPSSEAFNRLHRLSVELAGSDADIETGDAYVQLQAQVARLYGLGRSEFGYVLDTFPLIPRHTRDACLAAFGTA